MFVCIHNSVAYLYCGCLFIQQPVFITKCSQLKEAQDKDTPTEAGMDE